MRSIIIRDAPLGAGMGTMQDFIPVVDLFAGPGGLGEGFSAYKSGGVHRFRIGISIEMDAAAHATLKLRAFYRHFIAQGTKVPEKYYEHLQGKCSTEELFKSEPTAAKAADEEAWHGELGRLETSELNRRIGRTIKGAEHWVLIGGPPCQAYSLMGRAKMLGMNREKYLSDPRHLLYEEYLRTIAEHRPTVFVMENVKGLLSATISGRSTFERILEDLRHPRTAVGAKNDTELEYHIYSLSTPAEFQGLFKQPDFHPSQYVVQCEKYGIPQARHRVILLGIRKGIDVLPNVLEQKKQLVPMWEAIKDLPRIRSSISKTPNTAEAWIDAIRDAVQDGDLADVAIPTEVRKEIRRLAKRLSPQLQSGSEFIESDKLPEHLPKWYHDPRIGGVCNHTAKRHRVDDIWRYFFASSYAKVLKQSPKLRNFPHSLLPDHANVDAAVDGSMFSDRFRVQVKGRPATTVTLPAFNGVCNACRRADNVAQDE